jgi:hypothetical protein
MRRAAGSSEYSKQTTDVDAKRIEGDRAGDGRDAKDGLSHMRLAISTKIHRAKANTVGQ